MDVFLKATDISLGLGTTAPDEWLRLSAPEMNVALKSALRRRRRARVDERGNVHPKSTSLRPSLPCLWRRMCSGNMCIDVDAHLALAARSYPRPQSPEGALRRLVISPLGARVSLLAVSQRSVRVSELNKNSY